MARHYNNYNRGMGGSTPDTIHYEEEIIGLNSRVTVVGTVCDSMGDLRIKSTEKNKVIVSTKSAEEIVKDAKDRISTNKTVRVVCGVLSIIFVLCGIMGVF